MVNLSSYLSQKLWNPPWVLLFISIFNEHILLVPPSKYLRNTNLIILTLIQAAVICDLNYFSSLPAWLHAFIFALPIYLSINLLRSIWHIISHQKPSMASYLTIEAKILTVIAINISVDFFLGTDKVILKYIWKGNRTRIAKTVWKRKTKVEGLTLPEFKT